MNELAHYIDEAKRAITPSKNHIAFFRNNALSLFEKSTIPTRKIESWKYTNIKSMLEKNFIQTEKSQKDLNLKKMCVTKAYNLFFINGVLDKDLSDETPIEITELKNLSESEFIFYQDQIDEDLKNDFAFKMNSAFLNLGHVLKLKENIELEKPVVIHHVQTGENSQLSTFNIVHLKEDQKLDLFEIFKSEDPSFCHPSSLIYCEAKSKMEHIVLQNTHQESLFLGCFQSILKKKAIYNNVSFHLGSKKSRCFFASSLSEEGAATGVHGLYPLSDDQHHDTFAKLHHKAPGTFGDQLYKGILADSSKGIFTGKILIDKEAQLTQAKQLNKNLLLSVGAHAYSRPQLEVYADDVKCAHGSTTGQLSDDELFYFEARGISKEKARQMLAKAFAFDVVLKIKLPLFREIIKQELEKKQLDIL